MDEGQLPAFTFSINDLLDPSKIRGARSETLKVISTKESRRVLGSEQMASPDTRDRRILRIGEDDVDLYRAEVIKTRQDRDMIECVALGGSSTWFDYAKRFKLQDFAWGQSFAPLNSGSIGETWTDEDGLIYFPLVDYGYLEDRSDSFTVQPWRMRPGLRLHRILSDAIAPFGYTFKPRGLLANVWKKFIVLAPGEVRTMHPKAGQHGAYCNPPGTFGYTLTELGTTPDATFLDATIDPEGHIASSLFVTTETGTMDVRVDGIGLGFDPFAPPSDGEWFYLQVYDFTNGVVLASEPRQYHTGDDSIQWWHTFKDVPVVSGVDIGLSFQVQAGGFTGSAVNILDAAATFYPNGLFRTQEFYLWNEEDIVFYSLPSGIPIDVASIMPDLTLVELLKGITNNQCLVVDTDTRTREINLWFDSEYMRTANPGITTRDWSGRMDHSTAPVKELQRSPLSVKFRFKEDKGDFELLKASVSTSYPGYGNADFDDPLAYDQEQTITLPFAATVMGELFGGNCIVPIMRRKSKVDGTPVADVYQIDEYDREPRLLIADGVSTGDWEFTALGSTVYPKCYFVTEENGYSLAFGTATSSVEGTAERYWTPRLQRNAGRALECYLKLRDNELWNFDHGMPTLVDDGSGPRWYWVAEISGHRFGKNSPTKCTLIEAPFMPFGNVVPAAACRYAMLVEGGSIDGLYTYAPPDSWIYPGGVPGDDNISPISGAWGMFSGGVGIYLTLTPPPATPGPWTGWVDYATGLIPGPTVTLVC